MEQEQEYFLEVFSQPVLGTKIHKMQEYAQLGILNQILPQGRGGDSSISPPATADNYKLSINFEGGTPAEIQYFTWKDGSTFTLPVNTVTPPIDKVFASYTNLQNNTRYLPKQVLSDANATTSNHLDLTVEWQPWTALTKDVDDAYPSDSREPQTFICIFDTNKTAMILGEFTPTNVWLEGVKGVYQPSTYAQAHTVGQLYVRDPDTSLWAPATDYIETNPSLVHNAVTALRTGTITFEASRTLQDGGTPYAGYPGEKTAAYIYIKDGDSYITLGPSDIRHVYSEEVDLDSYEYFDSWRAAFGEIKFKDGVERYDAAALYKDGLPALAGLPSTGTLILEVLSDNIYSGAVGGGIRYFVEVELTPELFS